MNRKSTFLVLPLLAILFLVSCKSTGQEYYLLIGTYTNTGSKGIYVYNFDSKTGAVKWVSNTDSSQNPSYLAVSNNGKNVYAVNETGGSNPGRVSAYSFNNSNGKLTFLNSTYTGGDGPCYVSVSPNNNWLAVANYGAGSATMLPLNGDGSIKPFTQLINDSIYKNGDENAKSHVHAAVFSPDGKFLYTPDLGLDKVIIYNYKQESNKPLILASPAYVESQKGTGPRHMVFHPNKKFAYVVHEMGGTVTAYRYENGKLIKLEEVPTFPAGFAGKKDGAEITISPDGKFLYMSNRGDLHSITIFSIDPSSGKLSLIGYQPTLGKNPRNFMIDPTGNFLLVANMETNDIIIFKRDKKTGLLSNTKNRIELPRPVSLSMTPKQN